MVGRKPFRPSSRSPATGVALEQYTPRLHQYLRRMLRDSSAIPDIVQEIFKRFLSRAERKEIIQDPLAFLLGMARNVARELLYEEKRRMVIFDSDYLESRGDALDDASSTDVAEELAIQTDIARVLTRLPDAHLAVLMLVDAEGRSHEEAARLTGFTRSTVATYLVQARAKLKALLEDENRSRNKQDASS